MSDSALGLGWDCGADRALVPEVSRLAARWPMLIVSADAGAQESRCEQESHLFSYIALTKASARLVQM